MLENLIISLILMFVSGITFIAYKHPELYDDKFYKTLTNAAFLTVIITQVYSIGISLSFTTIKEYIPAENIEKAESALSQLEPSLYILYGAFAIWIYCLFLAWLSYHMKNIGHNKH